MENTLKTLRVAAGMTLAQVADRLAKDYPSLGITTCAGVFNLERRGTERLPVLRALAELYDARLSEIEQAARPVRQKKVSVSA